MNLLSKKTYFLFFFAINLAGFSSSVFAAESQATMSKKDWNMSESPELEVKFSGRGIAERVFDWATYPVREKKVVFAKLTSETDGQTKDLNVGDDFSVDFSSNGAQIELSSKLEMKPGKQTLEAKIASAGEEYDITQDFTWGVLAFNTNKSIYLPGEAAKLSFGTVDDNGHTLCDSELVVVITNPFGQKTTLKTSDGTISKSGECRGDSVTAKPDYSAEFQTQISGKHQIEVTAQTKNGQRTLSDTFEVRNEVPFEIERVNFPTRIYPPAPYEVTLKIKADENYKGVVKEKIPASFDITNISNEGLISDENESKIIEWQVDFEKGQTYSLNYTIKFPSKSPEFYLLGPLAIGSFSEARQWQIAADATRTWIGTTDANWDTATNWVSNIKPGNGDTVVFDSNSTANLATNNDIASLTGLTIQVVDPAGAVSIVGNDFTLGSGGIDMSAATQDLTISSSLTLAAEQSWTVANGKTLTISGTIDNGGFLLTITGLGNTSISGVISGAGGLTKSGAGTLTMGAGFTATGGTTTTSGNYIIHTFTTGGTFTPTASGNVEVLVIAGGGGGGGGTGGGAGAGGLLYDDNFSVTAQEYTVTVGDGGAGGNTSRGHGYNGSNSVFSSLTAFGGGAGGSNYGTYAPTSGGSGGGAGYTSSPGAGTAGQGYGGGAVGVWSGSYPNGGGGGAGAKGDDAVSNTTAGAGGAGLSCSISGSPQWYAGGGGGGLFQNGTGAVGGSGVGGHGGASGGAGTTGGAANTGSGGGGQGGNSGTTAGSGGSGIVIIRYQPSVNTYTGDTIISAGTFKLGTAAAIPDNSAVTVDGTLDLNGKVETVGSLAGSGTITSGAAGTPILAAGGNNTSTTFSGIIQNGSATSVGLTKAGTGATTLSGDSSFTGLTTVSAGTVKLGAAGGGTNTPLGTIAAGTTVASGAVLDLNGFTLGTAEPLTLNGTGISSGGALINSSATPATYSGLLTLGSASSIIANNGIIISNAGTITGATFGLTLGGTGSGTLGSILGTTTGTLTKEGAGTWILTGANTYVGTTTISAGILQIGNNGTSGALGGGSVANSGTLTFYRSDNISVTNEISGTGDVVKQGAGTLTLGSSSGISATGGTITYDGAYTLNTFTSDGTFTPSATGNIEVLVVAGGGGGASFAGGGGAGGLVYDDSFTVTAQAYSVTVGDGGTGSATSDQGLNGNNGEDSIFDTITATGGGGGGSRMSNYNGKPGNNGGSGGGGAPADSGTLGTGGSASPAGQGNKGGDETSYGWGGGGGGGAGAAGANAVGNEAGAGGDGVNTHSNLLIAANAGEDISGVHWIAGGGGGGTYTGGGSAAAGGNGGGGDGSKAGNGTAGTANTGGGGGGSGYNLTGGTGGSGIVIIRYATQVNNTYTGDTIISAGTLALGTDDAFVSANTSIASGAILDLAGFDLTSAGSTSFSNSGTIKLLGGETVTNAPTNNANSLVQYYGTSGPYTLKDWTYDSLQLSSASATAYNLPAALTINKNLTIDGNNTLDTTASNYNINIAGNFTNSGTYTGNNSTVTINGGGTSILSYSAATSFYGLNISTGGKTVKFDDTYQTNVTSSLVIQGTDCTTGRVFLASETNGNQWDINYTGSSLDIDYADIEDSNAVAALTADSSTADNDNNTGWTINGCGPSTGNIDVQGSSNFEGTIDLY
jgi:autotransporter-associated beta strand protein